MEAIMFYILGGITLASACCVVFMPRPVHNVIAMIMTMIGLAGLFILLRAEFVAMVQLIVYAGAVMVLFLFVVMLLNLDEIRLPDDPGAVRWWIGMGLVMVLALVLFPILKAIILPAASKPITTEIAGLSNTEQLAREIFTTYLLPFEVASVLLLAAIIGAVILVRKKD